jgi:hypothetical protein
LMLAAADVLAALVAHAHNSSEPASAAAAGEEQQQDDSHPMLLLAASCTQPSASHQLEPAAAWSHAEHLRLPLEDADTNSAVGSPRLIDGDAGAWQLVLPQPEGGAQAAASMGAERLVLVDLHLQQPLASSSNPGPDAQVPGGGVLSVLQAGDDDKPSAAGSQHARQPQHSMQVWLWRVGLLAVLSGLQLVPLVLHKPAAG